MARGRVRSRGGGGGLSSSKSTGFFGKKSMTTSPSQQQDNLVKSYPGAACIITRPKSHRSGGAGSPYPYDICQDHLNYYYDAIRLCGSDCITSTVYRKHIRDLCGIEVSPDELQKKQGSTSTDADAAAHL